MSGVTGPNLVTDGLKLFLDAGNVQSYVDNSTKWYDLSGNNMHANLGGQVGAGGRWSSDNGGYLDFDKDEFSAATFASAPATSLVTQTGTFCFWVNYTSITNYGALFYMHSTVNTDYFRIVSSGGEIKVLMEDANSVILGEFGTSGFTAAYVGNWVNFVVRQDGTNCTIYTNLTANGTVADGDWLADALGGALATHISYAYISAGSTNYLDAKLAMVYAYNRALSTVEMEQNFNAHKSRFGL